MTQKALFWLALPAWMLFAVNAEELHPAPAWKSSIYGGFSSRSGNTDEQSYSYGGEFEKKNGSAYRYKLKVDGKYRKTDNEVSDSKAEGSGEMRRLFSERGFFSGSLAALHDDLKNLTYRTKLGPGIGHYFVETDPLTADISTGLLHVHEKTADDSADYLAWRLSHWFDWHITETLRWWIGNELFVNTSDSSDWLILSRIGIDSKINGHFSLILALVNEYDNRPDAQDIEKNDFEVSAGLRYTF